MERSSKGFGMLTLLVCAFLVNAEGGREVPKEHGGEAVYTPQHLFDPPGLGGLGWVLGLGLGLGLPFGLGGLGLPFGLGGLGLPIGFPDLGLSPLLKGGKPNTKEVVFVPKPEGDGKKGGYYP